MWTDGLGGGITGYLFFLRTGILWGFKKPLFFFPFAAIDSVSYTSVLQRTFNLNISTTVTPSSSSSAPATETRTQDFEFSMLDQADFAHIDAYIRQHNLHDASMAEQRRAKRLNINGGKQANGNDGGEAGGADEGGDGVGELERAAREVREMDEDEDEDEEGDENFDPGSEGESEGSGSSEEEGEGEVGGGDDGDLVGEELGSEAEEVDMDGEE